jgi:hypothetical protein
MSTPTVFQLGKLENVVKEINEGTGSVHTFVSQAQGSAISISLTLPEMSNDIRDLDKVASKLLDYFGLAKDDVAITAENGYHRTRMVILSKSTGLEIKVSSK